MMKYSSKDKDRVISFYDTCIAEFGPHTPQALSWISEETQQIRFKVLCEIGEVNRHSILDVGCGFGDLYDFLTNNFQDVSYYGIDVHEKMIAAAREKRPGVRFEVMEFGEYSGDRFDYVFASGALCINVTDHKKLHFAQIRQMFECSTIGTAFNMLNAKYNPPDDELVSYSIPEVYEFCSGLSDRIVIRQDYLLQDFTVYIYR